MKHALKFLLLAGTMAALLLTACDKRNLGPKGHDCSTTKETPQSKVAAPTILATHSSHVYVKSGSLIITDFNQTTANFYVNTLYIHWRPAGGGSGSWSNGQLPTVWSNPVAHYPLMVGLVPGITIEVVYSTNPGTTLSVMGSTSPIYSVPI